MAARFAFVGCRTTRERNARGDGIRVYRAEDSGPWQPIQTLDAGPNPSFLALDHSSSFLYCVHGDFSSASSFAIADDGSLTQLNTEETGGRNPVHLQIDRSGTCLVVANYAGGNVALLPIRPDGRLAPRLQDLELPGPNGPHRIEQNGSHPHQVLIDRNGRFVIPDKGLDRVFIVTLDLARGRLDLDERQTVVAKEGAAPRHAVQHPDLDFMYVANELDSTVTTYRYAAGAAATPIEVITTLPTTCIGKSHAAGIVITPDGRYVYVSNRGDDSIACFAIDPSTCALRPNGWTSSGGAKPRFITLDNDGATLFAANEDSDSIHAFAIDARTGVLRPEGEVARTGSPTCVVFN